MRHSADPATRAFMDPTLGIAPGDTPFDFTAAEWALVLTGALLMRALPLLIALSAILKLRRFPALRPLHALLLAATGLTIALGLIDTMAPGLVPVGLRNSGVWSFFWIFALAWLGVTWVRSAIKTGLRPRATDIATLACAAALALAASGLILPMAFAR